MDSPGQTGAYTKGLLMVQGQFSVVFLWSIDLVVAGRGGGHGRGGDHYVPLGLFVLATEEDPRGHADSGQEQSASGGHDDGQVVDIGLGRVQDHTCNRSA